MNPHPEQYWINLGIRAAAVTRWAPGMLVYGGDRITEWTLGVAHGVVPDLRDPATLGVVLDQVREALGDPTVRTQASGPYWFVASGGWGGDELTGEHATEPEALIVALETAKRGEA